MELFILDDNVLKPLTPQDPGAFDDLMAREYGVGVTIGEHLAQAQPLFWEGHWIVPNPLFTTGGAVDPQGLSFACSTVITEHADTSRLEASVGTEVVHASSANVMKKGIVKQMGPFPINTKYGVMSSADLIADHSDGSQKYWLQLPPETAALRAAEKAANLEAVATNNPPGTIVQWKDLVTASGVVTLELVHCTPLTVG